MKKLRVIFGILIIYIFTVTANAAQVLIPGGQVIGLELQEGTVTVAGFHEELGNNAKKAGLMEGDRILRIGDTSVTCAADVRSALSQTEGKVHISILRNGKTKQLSIQPAATAEGPKLGVYLKQGTTGVGTVTYYNPEEGTFAALGHGVNTKNGNLLQLHTGSIYGAKVQSVKKGSVGTPGQLMGQLTNGNTLGSISKNTAQGVFGKLSTPIVAAPLPVADPGEVKVGAATIRSTVAGSSLQEYSVEILKIYPNSDARTRNMLIHVTDPALLETTGGIVQGMSGSPIIQDGKLVGAVTHVLVNDPTTGYGIFIENMLDAAA